MSDVCATLSQLFWTVAAAAATTVPQWEAADAEIKVPSVENTELIGSPLKPGV